LCKREEGWPEAHFERLYLKKGFEKVFQHPFHVSHMGAFVYDKALKLMKHWRMCLVAVVAIGPARYDDTDRRLNRFHRSDLYRRRMRAQNFALPVRVHEKCIMH